MFRLLSLLISAAICTGFTPSTKQHQSHTLLQGIHDEGNYYDDFSDFGQQGPADDSFLHSSEHGQQNDESMNDDWRSFRAKLVAGERSLKPQEGAFGMSYEPQQVQHKEKEPPMLTKSQWAHPIDHLETGSILIANENMGGLFYGKVLLIVDHTWEGTTAVVINR